LGAQLIDPIGLIGDLTLRRSPRRRFTLVDALAATVHRLRTSRAENAGGSPVLLALDWSGGQSQLIIGRHRGCDVVLSNPAVSRRHARLVFRDGNWVLQDLQSTNGTAVNGMNVGRCELRPGDHVTLGDQRLKID
jgi:FHA domain